MSVWDRPMRASEQDDQRPTAVPGEYEFTVAGIDGKEYPGKPGGMGRCAWLNVRLIVDGKDSRGKDLEVTVFENLFNDPKMEWRMLEFAKSVGIYHDDITAGEIMTRGEGMIGKAKFRVGEWNGKKRNEVDRFIVPPKAQPQQQEDIEIPDGELPF